MISYIITHRSDGRERDLNLNCILAWIDSLDGDKEIIVVEQDASPHINLPAKIKHAFVKNDGLFSKAWGMNIGIRHSSCDIIVFCDSDCLFKTHDMNQFLRTFRQNSFDVGSPNRKAFWRLNASVSNMIREDIDLLPYDTRIKPKGTVLTGGLFAARRKAIDDVKWWDEDFVGWGGEDNAMASKFNKFKKSIFKMSFTGYHLWHHKTADNRINNTRLWKERYSARHKKEFFEHFKTISIDNLGREDAKIL